MRHIQFLMVALLIAQLSGCSMGSSSGSHALVATSTNTVTSSSSTTPIAPVSPATVFFDSVVSSLTGIINTQFATGSDVNPTSARISPLPFEPLFFGDAAYSSSSQDGSKAFWKGAYTDATSMVQVPMTAKANAGKVYVTAYSHDFIQEQNSLRRQSAVARFNADGSWDSSFAGGGILQIYDFIHPTTAENGTPGVTSLHLSAVAVDSTDSTRFLLAGLQQLNGGYYTLWVCRFNENGSLDASFNAGSKTTTGCYTYMENVQDLPWPVLSGWAYNMTVDAQGRIWVVGGQSTDYEVSSQVLVIRLLPNGTPDPNFGVDGKLIDSSLGDSAGQQVAFDHSGNLYILALKYSSNQYVVLKYSSAGVAIGTQPFIIPGFSVYHMAIDSNDRLVLGGVTFDATSHQSRLTVARYTNTGILDSTFANNGFYKTGVDSVVAVDGRFDDSTVLSDGKSRWYFNNVAYSLLIDAADNILVGGSILGMRTAHCASWNPIDTPAEAIAAVTIRLLSNGVLDSSYGTNGMMMQMNQPDYLPGDCTINAYINQNYIYAFMPLGVRQMIPNAADGSVLAVGNMFAQTAAPIFSSKIYIWNIK